MSVETLTPSVNTTWRLDVNTSNTETPNWIQVRALNSLQPAVNSTVQDASDYDSDGWGSDAVTQRKWQIVATALRKFTAADGAYDPGQEFLRTAADNLALVHVRWYERQGGGNGEAYEGHGLVQWAPQGGDPTGLNAVQVTVLGQGPRTAITNPAATSGS